MYRSYWLFCAMLVGFAAEAPAPAATADAAASDTWALRRWSAELSAPRTVDAPPCFALLGKSDCRVDQGEQGESDGVQAAAKADNGP